MLIAAIVIASIIALFVIIYFVEPFIIALLFSWLLSLFVRNPPYVDVEEEFPEGKLLKDNWKVIREELDEVLKNIENIPKFHEVDNLQKFISAKDDKAWRTFIIKGFNEWLDHNCEQVPRTTELIRQIPRVSMAMFSIIDGGKHIPPHYGFFKSVLRYHLAMVIPEGEVYILVNGEKYSWTEGDHVLFDDTYKHEVWKKTDQRRVVLFIDVMREKGLPKFMQGINRWMFGILRNSKKLQKAAKNAEVPKDIAA
jgi:aspartyl/asparaginyl beta-hydroxylase (cupin superfamily)